MKILLTSSSFIETPGSHHNSLNDLGFDVTKIKGPLKEAEMLEIIDKYDFLICGDDELTENVLSKGVGSSLKCISKYGVGLDKIDLNAIKKFNIPLTNCPGVNQISVAEHVFALILSFYRNIPQSVKNTSEGNWIRQTGREIYGKRLGIYGVGAIGKEVAKRANCFGLQVFVYDKYLDSNIAKEYNLISVNSLTELISNSDILTIHVPLNNDTKHSINKDLIEKIPNKLLLVNTARGEIVESDALLKALKTNKIEGYLTDVLDIEPISKSDPLKGIENVFITPHIGSRTYESVERQGNMAVENLKKMIENL